MTHLRNGEFGRYTTLRTIPADTDTDTNTDQKTKTMQISFHSFQLLQNHSMEYHAAEDQPISYDQCLQELCNFWNLKHNQKYIYFGRRN